MCQWMAHTHVFVDSINWTQKAIFKNSFHIKSKEEMNRGIGVGREILDCYYQSTYMKLTRIKLKLKIKIFKEEN